MIHKTLLVIWKSVIFETSVLSVFSPACSSTDVYDFKSSNDVCACDVSFDVPNNVLVLSQPWHTSSSNGVGLETIIWTLHATKLVYEREKNACNLLVLRGHGGFELRLSGSEVTVLTRSPVLNIMYRGREREDNIVLIRETRLQWPIPHHSFCCGTPRAEVWRVHVQQK